MKGFHCYAKTILKRCVH